MIAVSGITTITIDLC